MSAYNCGRPDRGDEDGPDRGDEDGPDLHDRVVTCWCGASGTFDELFDSDCLDEECGGSGELGCYCGGDLCVCHHHGAAPCPGCEACGYDPDDLDDLQDYYDDFEEDVRFNPDEE